MSVSIWDQVLGRIEAKVGRHSFHTWFKPTALLADEGALVIVRVPNNLFTEWLPKHYAVVLAEAFSDVGRPNAEVVFIPEGATPESAVANAALTFVKAATDRAAFPETTPDPAAGAFAKAGTLPAAGLDYDAANLSAGASAKVDLSAGASAKAEAASSAVPEQRTARDDLLTVTPPGGLNPRYTFDTFIVGASNQFAHAACRAVAEVPSRSYNPLFIYGGVGLGKTHLMHAIGQYVLQHSPGLKLTYISSERFMNEMINAVRFDRVLDFRERYRTVDVLLVDDIQFVSRKEATQTEFFHTFNALHDAQKQIVISSDRPPHEIPALEERLRSRFEWGLIADIQQPDIETKVAILKKKAEAEVVPLPDSVAMYIASRIKSNIRELEGSLIRLIAYASLTGQSLSIELAQQVLRNVLDLDEKAITIEQIQKFVAEYYQLKLADLKSRNNSKSIAMPRQVAMYLCKQLTHASLPEIGRSFGGKHHSTVIHSIKKVEDLRKKDGNFNSVISNLMDSVK